MRRLQWKTVAENQAKGRIILLQRFSLQSPAFSTAYDMTAMTVKRNISQPKPILQRLTTELIQSIASFLGNDRDINSLSRANSHLYTILNPLFARTKTAQPSYGLPSMEMRLHLESVSVKEPLLNRPKKAGHRFHSLHRKGTKQ